MRNISIAISAWSIAVIIAIFTPVNTAHSSDKAVRGGVKPNLQSQMDRLYNDYCFKSNCDNVPAHRTARAQVEDFGTGSRSPDSTFISLIPSYPPGVSCTSLLGEVGDNQNLTVLEGNVTVDSSGEALVTISAEPRIQRANGATEEGIGAIGGQITLEGPFDAIDPPTTTTIFSRWVLHSAVASTEIDAVSNPSQVNQPIINTVAVNRYLSGLTPGSYTIRANFKWSTVFTSLPLETSTASFATGQRGALVCQPNLIVETWPL